jgi:hypothetical protein
MAITLRVNDDEMAAIKSYAELQGVTVSNAVRTAILERIEDEMDIEIALRAYNEWKKDGKKTFSMDEAQKALGL